MKTPSLVIVIGLCLTSLFEISHSLSAGEADWPQWRGPQRDGHAAEQELLQQWPEGGPKLAWKADDLGTGYSAVSVVDDRVFTMGSKDGKSLVICLGLDGGQTIWQTEIGRAGDRGDYNTGWGDGQRGTPTVDGDQVFSLSDVGVLAALEKKTGKLQWKVDLVADFGGSIPQWGFSESPLVDGDRVLVTPGDGILSSAWIARPENRFT